MNIKDKITLAGVNALASIVRSTGLPRGKKEIADAQLERLRKEPLWVPEGEDIADVAMVYGTSSKEFEAMDRRAGGSGRL